MRLIDADALEKQLRERASMEWNQGVATSWSDAYLECADIVGDAPTVDPVKHGHWIMKPNGYGTCSNCKRCSLDLGAGVDSDYCPNCGAKMTPD